MFFLLDVCVCIVMFNAEGSINSQEYNSFQIDAVSINISMTEYRHWINDLVDHLF